jgi:hypothetical protein
MKEYIYLRVFGGLLLRCCCYHSFSGQQSLPSHILSKKILMQFKLLRKRVANIEGIILKGFKNSLEKALTYAHIKKGNSGAFNMPMINYVRKVKL